MAYTKTTWADGTTPISAANMNKIEQGIYDIENVNLKYFGKFSQMSGGAAKSEASGIITFSTEAKDDLSVINIGTSNSRITIPAALNGKYGRFFVSLSMPSAGPEFHYKVELYKNGVSALVIHHGALGSNVYSIPVALATNDYFEIYYTDSVNSPTGISAGSIFGMEVIG